MIAIVNYNMGNLRSVEKAVLRLGFDCVITNAEAEIRSADKIILPGVGHFGRGMEELGKLGLVNTLNELVLEQKKPILGICLGMQLMTSHSQEGDVDGLGWLEAETLHFELSAPQRVPHIGWNTVNQAGDSMIYEGIEDDAEFYFVHSYYVRSSNPSIVSSTTEYGHSFDSGFAKDNIYGFQFHPEKSHGQGLQLLNNFLKLNV